MEHFKELFEDLLAGSGAGLIIAGAWRLSHGAAFIVAGVVLLRVAAAMQKRTK